MVQPDHLNKRTSTCFNNDKQSKEKHGDEKHQNIPSVHVTSNNSFYRVTEKGLKGETKY